MKRDANVEVFRCLLMALIVLNHCYCFGPWYANGAMWTLFFTTFIHWHVDAFIGISGWFGIKTTAKKFLRLWGLMMFYNIVGCALTYWLCPHRFAWSQLFSLGAWFGGCYLALMLIAPLLNAGIDALVNSRRAALLAGGGVMAIVALTWLPGHFMTGINANGSGQFSFVNMMGVYIVARILKQINFEKVSLKTLMIGPMIWAIGIVMIGGAKTLLQVVRRLPHTSATWDFLAFYDAPHYWVMALSMLLIFVWHVRVPDWLGRVCLFIAPSMFPIYLMHTTTGIGHEVMFRLEEVISQNSSIHPALIIVITAVCVFVGCLLIDLIRRAVINCVTH